MVQDDGRGTFVDSISVYACFFLSLKTIVLPVIQIHTQIIKLEYVTPLALFFNLKNKLVVHIICFINFTVENYNT